jgi:Rrf2 family nitric oxide-sensitive transcriptional repressor
MRQTDYALRVLLYLAQRPGRHCSIAEMSRAHRISHDHLTKVVHGLVKAGYLASIRGRMGGVRLARDPDAINIGAVVRLMECDLTIVDCAQCVIRSGCGFRSLFDRALDAFLATLDGETLGDVLAAANPIAPPPMKDTGFSPLTL